MTLLSLALLTAHAAPVKIAGVEAKSYYNEGGASYHPDNAKDGKTSPWYEGDSGNGVGSWIEVDLGGERRVTRVQAFAGDWTNRTRWTQANRPAELEIRWSDGSTDIWALADEWKVQTFAPSSPKTTSKIRFKLNSIHSGTAFPDTAISEILVFDDQPGAQNLAKSAQASSEFPDDGDGSYVALQASDGLRDTMWCEGAADGDGAGEWVEFELRERFPVKGLQICAGMCASLGIHKKGNAPTTMTAEFADGKTQQFTLKDFPLPQKVTFEVPHVTDKVKLKIDKVRAGSEFNDACISDVAFLR